MSVVRFPQRGVELIRYVRGQKIATDEEVFDTYAHLLCFAACLGFERDEKDGELTFADRPNPIDFDILRNNGLLQLLQIMVLAKTGQHEMLREDRVDEFIALVEGYASGGFRVMRQFYEEDGESFYYRTLVRLLDHAAGQSGVGADAEG